MLLTRKAVAPKLKIWDYDESRYVRFTSRIAFETRTDASAWPGSIEGGVDLARQVLTNKVRLCFNPIISAN